MATAFSGRAGGRGGKKGGRKGKQKGVGDFSREVPAGQAAFFGSALVDSMPLGGDGEDAHLMEEELEVDSPSTNTRLVFDPVEARDLMDERWQDCITNEKLEVVTPSNAKTNPKFNLAKEMAKLVQRHKQIHGLGEALEE
eukprot:EG_transcript_21056